MGCDIHIRLEHRLDGKWHKLDADVHEDFGNRNYNLFGIMADVRNGTWGDKLPPIAAPRGFPSDMSEPVIDAEDEATGWLGDHSFSWVTLRELQEYDWDAPLQMRGWVSHEQAEEYRRTGVPPTSYAAGGNHGEYVTFKKTRREAVYDWPAKVLPALAKLGAPDDVRLVFGFDS